MTLRTLTAFCLLMSVVPLAMWVQTGHGRTMIDANRSRRLCLIWERGGGGRVEFAWMMPSGGLRYGPTRAWEDERRDWPRYDPLATRWQFGPFGCDLSLSPLSVMGEIVVPLWFVSLMFLAYPAWRAYRGWRPKAVPARGAFEPVVDDEAAVVARPPSGLPV